MPYEDPRRPRELLTQANAMLGQGQLSLAKYLLIVAGEDDPDLDIHDVPEFLRHLLERVDWRRDLHFQTPTTIDTLDYSGDGLNEGSKLVIAAAGPAAAHAAGGHGQPRAHARRPGLDRSAGVPAGHPGRSRGRPTRPSRASRTRWCSSSATSTPAPTRSTASR